MADISDYQNLVTSEHAGKPKFMAMIAAVAGAFVDQQNFLDSLPDAFDIDQATGHRLDVIGQWVGLDRSLKATAPGIYTPAPPAGVVPLSDADYQTLLRGKVGSNNWKGSISSAYDKLTYIFGTSGSRLFMIDNQDMTETVCVAGNVPSAGFKAALTGGYMQVRPCGVDANFKFPTAPGGPLFGFGIDNQFVGGFGHGVWLSNS